MTDMNALRTDLIHNSHYLGVAAVREEVVWRRIGRADLLVTKDSAEKADEAARIAKTRKTEGKHDNGDDDGDVEPAEIVTPDPAFLTFVALISVDNFWLLADANWKGPTKFAPTLADAKASCRMVAPELSPFASDFSEVLNNVKWFMQRCATPGNAKQGIFDGKEVPVLSIKLRHVLFEAILASFPFILAWKDLMTMPLYSDPEDAETIQNWPVKSDAAQAALEEMKTTHRVIPLPAYNMKGNLIRATDYHRMLMGAVDNETSGRDTYTADIHGLRVLVPAPKLPATPKSGGSKRKIFATDPGSPSKKARTSC
ncbi:hypothetical protein B0H11DRAFT_2431735 [Mycena galericulata]|nr:hypothetical protein B0H11DRAFT_2431735 [Mycena galericulata]